MRWFLIYLKNICLRNPGCNSQKIITMNYQSVLFIKQPVFQLQSVSKTVSESKCRFPLSQINFLMDIRQINIIMLLFQQQNQNCSTSKINLSIYNPISISSLSSILCCFTLFSYPTSQFQLHFPLISCDKILICSPYITLSFILQASYSAFFTSFS